MVADCDWFTATGWVCMLLTDVSPTENQRERAGDYSDQPILGGSVLLKTEVSGLHIFMCMQWLKLANKDGMWCRNILYSHVPSCSSPYKHFLCQLDTWTWFWAKLKLATLDSNLHLHRWVEELCKKQHHWRWALNRWRLVFPMLMGGVWPPRKMAVLSNSVWADGLLPHRLRVAHWVVSGPGRDLAGLHWQELEKVNHFFLKTSLFDLFLCQNLYLNSSDFIKRDGCL